MPEPLKPEKKDSIFNRGTFVGLGQFLKNREGAAYLAIHEGQPWMNSTFEGGAGGGSMGDDPPPFRGSEGFDIQQQSH